MAIAYPKNPENPYKYINPGFITKVAALVRLALSEIPTQIGL